MSAGTYTEEIGQCGSDGVFARWIRSGKSNIDGEVVGRGRDGHGAGAAVHERSASVSRSLTVRSNPSGCHAWTKITGIKGVDSRQRGPLQERADAAGTFLGVDRRRVGGQAKDEAKVLIVLGVVAILEGHGHS